MVRYAPSEMSLIFSNACAALLNGEKLINDTIFPNFAKSFIESWTAEDLEPMSSVSLASNMAYPEDDSKSTCVTILKVFSSSRTAKGSF